MEASLETQYPDSAQRVRVVVVDDEYLVLQGIATLLQMNPRIEVVGTGSNGQEAIDLASEPQPDVVLTDIRMPILDGIQAIGAIKTRWPDMRVALLTSFAQDGYVLEGLSVGADGYLLKGDTPASLISGLISIAAGHQVVEQDIGRRIAELVGEKSPERSQNYDGLTPRELQVLVMVVRGQSVKDIAADLCISERTARNHLSGIYHKLGVFDRAQAVLYAIKKGLVTAE
jgi:DNA-binding NarL/FixJ family response regulator